MSILSPNEVAYLAGRHWAGEDQVIAVAVCYAESKFDTEAFGYSKILVDGLEQYENVDHGLMQISNKWNQRRGDGTPGRLLIAAADWRDPYVNFAMAKGLFDEFVASGRPGWNAWHAFTSGAHVKYLPMARLAVKAAWTPPVEQSDEALAKFSAALLEGTQ